MSVTDSERKFVGNTAGVPFALAWLQHNCLKDGSYPEGRISSIYYDTPDLALYEEKASGDFVKVKCRLRWYDPDVSMDPGACTAFMEIKRRCGEGRRKSRTRITLNRDWIERAPLDDPAFDAMLAPHALPLKEWLPPGLAAAVMVRYYRYRFVCPFSHARISLDTAIEAARANARLIPTPSSVMLEQVVVEIKGGTTDHIPWLYRLQGAGFMRRSFSKYGGCVSRMLGEE